MKAELLPTIQENALPTDVAMVPLDTIRKVTSDGKSKDILYSDFETQVVGVATLAAKDSADAAKVSEDNAKESETNAAQSEADTLGFRNEAEAFKNTASSKADIATTKAQEALTSEQNALASRNAAEGFKNAAGISAAAALVSEQNADLSEAGALQSKNYASGYADDALASKNAAKVSETNAYNAQSATILGGIAYNAVAPTPGKSGKYHLTTGGSITWLTGGALTGVIGQEILVVYTAPSTYVYTLLAVTANYALKTDVSKSNDITSRFIYGYDFRYNNAWAAGCKIDANGNFLTGQSGSSMMGCLGYLNPEATIIHLKARAYVTGGSSYLFAFYNSNILFDSTTLVGAFNNITATSTATIEADITIPENAKALVVCCYTPETVLQAVEYIPINETVESIENDIPTDIALDEILNGKPTEYITMENMYSKGGYLMMNRNYIENTFECISNAENKWCASNAFNPSGSHYVHIKFKIEFLDSTSNLTIAISKGVTSGSTQQLQKITEDGEYDIVFDPTYYRIYQTYATEFHVWFWAITNAIHFKISDFRVFESMDELQLANIDGVNAKEMFLSVDDMISDINTEIERPTFSIAPNGTKYELVVDNSGQLVARGIIPLKSAFFGNSLLSGSAIPGVIDFGMCASEIANEFYTKFNNYALTLNPAYTSGRYSAVNFETISNEANIDSVVAAMMANIEGDEDLIVVQAGDNTTAALEPIFAKSTVKLLKAIRAKCPNARVCWLAIWYSSVSKMDSVRNACRIAGCTIVPISSLNIAENQATIGNLIDFGVGNAGNWTLADVTSVVENTPTNITVSYTYNGSAYSTTLGVTSYSLVSTTLSYTSRYRIITVQYSHPGDRGMLAIANKLIYIMGLNDSDEYYPIT